MEKRIEKKIEDYMQKFKDDIKDKIVELGLIESSNGGKLLQYVYDRENLVLDKEDFLKRKRVNNVVHNFERCIAKRANDEKCTRRKKEGEQFCGTHLKGTPYGIETCVEIKTFKKTEIFIQDIQGIINYIDTKGNIYQVEDILENKQYPKCIGKYKIENGIYRMC